MFCCVSHHDKRDGQADRGIYSEKSLPTIKGWIIIHINSRHDRSCCSCLVVCGGKALGCRRLTQSLMVSVYSVSRVYMAAGCDAASSVVLSSAETRASWAPELCVNFLYVFAWFSTVVQMKWLMAVNAQHRAGACFTAHRLLSLINLFTQTEKGMGVGGCRDMDFGLRGRWTESVFYLCKFQLLLLPLEKVI